MGKLKAMPPRLKLFDGRAIKPVPQVKLADPELLTAAHRMWREAVCERAGWRCEWVEDGARCARSRATGHRMIADHKHERADGGAALDPANGQCLCTQHNTLKGVQARVARLRSTPAGGGGV